MRSNSSSSTLVKVVSLLRLLPADRFFALDLPRHPLQLFRPTSAFSSLPSSSRRHHRARGGILSSPRPPPPFKGAKDPPRKIAAIARFAHEHDKSQPRSSSSSSSSSVVTINMPLDYETLSAQNATTTNAIIEHYSSSSPQFLSLAESEGDGILKRDEEDASKLQKGIDLAKEKGVLDPDYVPEDYIEVDVLGKSPGSVADEILDTVRKAQEGGEGSAAGGVVVLCGLSGTGKGTTVVTLKEKLEKEDKKKVVCWSNGNIFRSVTLLAVTWCEQQDDCDGFDPARALTKENLASFVGMLEFGKFDGKFDTKISGLGLSLLVSEVQNTALKSPKVSRNIPTVAEVTQGEVVLFASDAVKKMGEDGIFVLLEGREQTVNYVRTPLRFTLVMSDATLIGKRRAAQRLAAGAAKEVGEGAGEEEVGRALDAQLASMAKEAGC